MLVAHTIFISVLEVNEKFCTHTFLFLHILTSIILRKLLMRITALRGRKICQTHYHDESRNRLGMPMFKKIIDSLNRSRSLTAESFHVKIGIKKCSGINLSVKVHKNKETVYSIKSLFFNCLNPKKKLSYAILR